MKAILVMLPESVLEATWRCAAALRMSSAAYVRCALKRMNRETRARLRAERLAAASRKVRKESMRVNAEFAAIERNPVT